MFKIRKNAFRFTVMVLLILMTVLSFAAPVSAADATNYTYTITENGEWGRSQDAYVVSAILMKNETLSKPQDIFVKNGSIYVADTGNSRIVIQDIKSGEIRSVGGEYLSAPSGVYVTEEGSIYVADTGAAAVFKLSAEGELLKSYERPTTVTFGQKTQYVPSKIAVNPSGILYVVSEGSFNGIVQLNQEGEFLGYFGYNNNPMTIAEYLQDMLFTENQKKMLFNRVPYSFYNLAMDGKGVVYSITQAAEGNALKKHNIAGSNLFFDNMLDEPNFVDVALGSYGQIYTITQTGLLFEYSTTGLILFSLGGLAIANERNDLITTATGVAADESVNVYILDGERGLIHVLCPTEFAADVHRAMDHYDNGHYEESRRLWEQIALTSGRGYMVEEYIASCLFQQQEYEQAAKHYRIAGDRVGYSEAYWQIRNKQSTIVLPYVFGAILIMGAFYIWWRSYRKKHPPMPKEHTGFARDMRLMCGVIRHPLDSFYAIRREGAGHIGTATLIYVMAYAVFVCNFILRGFIVSTHTPENTSLMYVSVLYLIPVILFVLSNFLVGEINESEGRFKDIYIATAYVMSPFVVIMPFIVVISHFMTLAESRLLTLVCAVIYAWVFILLVIAIKEIHAFTVSGLIKNLLITVFLMAVIILSCSVIGMFWDQLIDFVLSIIKEVKYRVS